MEASRTALVANATVFSTSRFSGDRNVVADRRADLVDALGAEPAGGLDSAAEPGDARLPAKRVDPPVLDIGDEEARRVRSHVDHRGSQERRW